MKKPAWALKVLKNFLELKAGKDAPFFASFSVTGRCNMRCVYCDWWKKDFPELSTAKALKVIDNVCSLGLSFFDFSGGEPLLRRDLTILAKRASSHDCLVSMNTNGAFLKGHRISEIASVFDVIVVSLDGPPTVHDKLRGVAGTFRKAFEAVKQLKNYGVRVGVNSVISPWNIKDLTKFIEELRAFVNFVQLQPIHPYPPPFQNRPSSEEILSLQEKLLKLKREDPGFLAVPADFIRGFSLFFDGKIPKICHAGRLYVAVNPSGQLLACSAREDVVLGSLLKSPAEKILKGKFESEGWFNVTLCLGCWLECTVGVAMTVENPIRETVHLATF